MTTGSGAERNLYPLRPFHKGLVAAMSDLARACARAGEFRRLHGGALPPAPDLGDIAIRQTALPEAKAALAPG
ncbi:MAG: hypothetical protein KDK26_09020 [Roseivivax sp.]|nr:hypothetical protein [Roseivivax sp.]